MKKISLSICLLLMISLCACTAGNSDNTGGTQVFTKAAEQTSETGELTTEPAEPGGDAISETVAAMSVEEKVGQMFFSSCPDVNAAEDAAKYHLGGYVLFGRDFDGKTAEEVKADIASYQEGMRIPLLIGADEEGGTVVRVSSNENLRYAPFRSPKDYYTDGGMDRVREIETEKAELLTSLGVNVNLAPVCDLTGDTESFMFERSFSDDAELTGGFISDTVAIYSEKKLGSVLKHFPGYGDCVDTHTGTAHDDRPYSTFANNDFKPFEAGIKAGADCIMVSHNIVECMDADYPASLSDKVHQIIRENLGFNGVIITDDLVMGAVSEYTGSENAAVLAAKAGNDMLCCSELEIQYPAVLQAVKNEEIPMEQIDNSVKRILKWKQKLGLI